jgi:hypothetical protein
MEVSEPIRQHQDVEQFGAGSGAEGIETLPQSALQLVAVQAHRRSRTSAGGAAVAFGQGRGSSAPAPTHLRTETRSVRSDDRQASAAVRVSRRGLARRAQDPADGQARPGSRLRLGDVRRLRRLLAGSALRREPPVTTRRRSGLPRSVPARTSRQAVIAGPQSRYVDCVMRPSLTCA